MSSFESEHQNLNMDQAVKERYAEGAESKEEALCCPVSYDPRFLEVIPQEIIEKDYGCGDPSRYLKEGDVVLDLGSGAGKICYIAAQVVGPKGRVIGVDFNPAMLELARKYQGEIAQKIGWNNVEFRRASIQDLKTDLDRVESELEKDPLRSAEDYAAFEARRHAWGEENPLIASDSVDVVVSNCVLNLVKPSAKKELFREMFRVLKRGGRAAISDIVSDEKVPARLQKDPELWSGCISGAFQEAEFLRAFEEAGFYGVTLEKREAKPWRVVEGIEFRSVTVTAWKGKQGECLERRQAVIYKGPWKQVLDDDGHIIKRGALTAVCDKTFQIYQREPYLSDFYFLEPAVEIPLDQAGIFDCSGSGERPARDLKGSFDPVSSKSGPEFCGPNCC